jgi:hypothetical protein
MRRGTSVHATIHGRLPASVEQIRYRRTSDHPGYYKHDFSTPTDVFALEDGGLLIQPRTSGGPMPPSKLWLDNPRRKHHRHHHRRNPYLAAYNPHATAMLKHYFSFPYAKTAASGAAGFAASYLGYKVVGSLTFLSTYAADPGYGGILARLGIRVAAAALGDYLLARFMPGHHSRVAYIGGAAAYVGLATALEAGGYTITVGAPGGVPLASVLPASLVNATIAGDLGAYMRPRAAGRRSARAINGVDAFLYGDMGAYVAPAMGGLEARVQSLFTNPLLP